MTLVANYLPLQDAYGGPNYFKLDPNALYEIHVDNNGDAKEDITFQFRFNNTSKGTTLTIGGTDVAIPLTQFGPDHRRPTRATLNVERDLHGRRSSAATAAPARAAADQRTRGGSDDASTSRSTTSA